MNESEIRERNRRIKVAVDKFIGANDGAYRVVDKVKNGGAFAVVFFLQDDDGKEYALKCVDILHTDIGLTPSLVREYCENEVETMKLTNKNKYIMDLLNDAIAEWRQLNDRVYLMLMPKETPASEFFSRDDVSFKDVISFTHDLCMALYILHSLNILHRDVKLGNTFYSTEKGCFVLGDLGTIRNFSENRCANVTRVGTNIAPEIKDRKPLEGRLNADIYSLGTTINEIRAVIAQKVTFPDWFNKIINKCCEENPAVRYQTVDEIIKEIDSHSPCAFDEDEKENACYLFDTHNDTEMIRIVKNGMNAGDEDMTVAYAYLLTCKKDYKKAFSVLAPLKDNGNPKAIGMYGIISGYEKTESGSGLSEEDVGMILASAEKGFSVAEYCIGRWYLSGTYGFPKDIEKGLSYLFDSFNKRYLAAAIYLKKSMRRHPEYFKNTSDMERMLDIVCDSLNKKDDDIYPSEMFRAIVLSSLDAPEGAVFGGQSFLT